MRWADWIDLGGAKKVQGSNYPQSMNLDKLFRILEEKVAHAVIGAAADDEPAAKKPKTVGATSAHPAEAPDVVPYACLCALVRLAESLRPVNTPQLSNVIVGVSHILCLCGYLCVRCARLFACMSVRLRGMRVDTVFTNMQCTGVVTRKLLNASHCSVEQSLY